MTAVEPRPGGRGEDERNLTGDLREAAETYWPYDRLLPSEEPVYVSKAFYLFGSLALASFISLVVTGIVLMVKGAFWWHTNDVGLFVNSLHFWSVQLFFFSMFVHFGSSFFTAAWRGGRGFTWLFGVLAFLVSVLTGLTGYILQSNFDGQYIGQQAKDAMNAVGLGGLLNLMDFDIVVGWHTILLPLGVALMVGLHLLWVRRHGVVPPFPPDDVSFHGGYQPGGPTRSETGSSTRSGVDPEDVAP